MKNFIILKNNKFVLNIVILGFWIIVWGVIALGVGNELYLPTPYQTFLRLAKVIPQVTFWNSVFSSMAKVITGFLIAMLIGVGFGIIGGLVKWIFELINPIMVSIKATPVVSIILILFVWLDSQNVPIFVCILMCLPIFWTSITEGTKKVDNKLLELSKLYKVGFWRKIAYIYIPSLKSYFKSAVILSLGLGWKVTIASEVITQPKNTIGAEIYSAKAYFESDLLFAWTVVVIILSYVFEVAFRKIIAGRFDKND